VRHLAKTYPDIVIRVLTRSAERKNAQELLSLSPNVSLVKAAFSDKQSLVKVFVGADVVFLITDYWNTQNNASVASLSTEIMDGITAIEAAAHTKGLKHFIFGTLMDFSALSAMKWRNMYHFSTSVFITSFVIIFMLKTYQTRKRY